MRKIALFIALVLCAVSCIYPYDVEVGGTGGNLVVEGDIVVGSVSYFALSRLIPLGSMNMSQQPVDAELWVEDRNGTRYPGVRASAADDFEVDLSAADPSLEYRLYIQAGNVDARDYCSAWSEPSGTCVIDELGYRILESGGKKTGALVRMSMHSEDGTKHFRYRYKEAWEYTSYWRADAYYVPELTEDDPNGKVLYFSGGENNYYCWLTNSSKGINLATTETMGVNRLDNYPLLQFSATSSKMSVLYRLDLEVYPVSEESYRYLEHIRDVSNYNGSLFAPIPSEVRGNLRCVQDDDEIVYGYVGISCPQKARLYIDNAVTNLYVRQDILEAESETVAPEDWYKYYREKDWRVYDRDDLSGAVTWAPRRCVDCTYNGGTKNKPSDWPNDHI